MITRDPYGISTCIRPGLAPEPRTGKINLHTADRPEMVNMCLNCQKSERECHGSCTYDMGEARIERDNRIRELARLRWSGKSVAAAAKELGITRSKATRWAGTQVYRREQERLKKIRRMMREEEKQK